MWEIAKRRSSDSRTILFEDSLNVVDQAIMGREPNIKLVNIVKLGQISGLRTPLHAWKGVLEPLIGIDRQCVFCSNNRNPLFVARSITRWMAATPE